MAFSPENDGGIVNNNVYFPFIPSFRASETRVESPYMERITDFIKKVKNVFLA